MDYKKFLSDWRVRNILGAFAVILLLSLGAKVLLGACTRHGKELMVPDFMGKTVPEAKSLARKSDVTIDVVDSIYVKGARRGSVVRQDPRASAKVKSGRRIQLTINASAPKQIPMPNLIGFSMRSAKAELISMGLVLDRLIYVEDIATNNVLHQLYQGSQIEPGTMVPGGADISLVLGLNGDDCTTAVPKVTGLTYDRAAEVIHDHSLNVNNAIFERDIKTYADSASAVVYRQIPGHGVVETMGRGVTVYLTMDSSKVPVENETVVSEQSAN